MHRLLLLLFVAIMFMSTSITSAETVKFLSVLPDIPLPRNAVEINDSATVFDSPSGRFVEVEIFLQGSKAAEALRFYNETLPSLGWSRTVPGQFSKENETLKVFISGQASDDRISILLQPR